MTPVPWILLTLCAASYLCGSFPSAYLAVKILHGKNIYDLGSGNGGATNVFRNFGKVTGGLVFFLDSAKGFLPVLASVIYGFSRGTSLIMIVFLALGHAFPPWTGFKGGKSVAVTAGAVSALIPGAVPFCLAAFFLSARLSGYASLGSLAAGLSLPLYYLAAHLIRAREDFLLTEGFLVFLFLLITFFHRRNIFRLIRGEEKTWRGIRQDREASFPEDGD